MRESSTATGLTKRPAVLARWVVAAMLATAGAVAGQGAHAQGDHGGPGGERGRPGMMMWDGPAEHMAHGLDRMLDGLGATAEQRTRVNQIAQAAAADLRSQREAGRAMHQRALEIFTAPTVDAGAAESLRQQMSAQREQASKRMLQAMLDIAKVLTPEQRAKIGDRMKDRAAMMKDRMQRMEQDHAGRPTAPRQP